MFSHNNKNYGKLPVQSYLMQHLLGFVPIELKANVFGRPRNQLLPQEGRAAPAGAGGVVRRGSGIISVPWQQHPLGWCQAREA